MDELDPIRRAADVSGPIACALFFFGLFGADGTTPGLGGWLFLGIAVLLGVAALDVEHDLFQWVGMIARVAFSALGLIASGFSALFIDKQGLILDGHLLHASIAAFLIALGLNANYLLGMFSARRD